MRGTLEAPIASFVNSGAARGVPRATPTSLTLSPFLAASKWIVVARSGAISMCLLLLRRPGVAQLVVSIVQVSRDSLADFCINVC